MRITALQKPVARITSISAGLLVVRILYVASTATDGLLYFRTALVMLFSGLCIGLWRANLTSMRIATFVLLLAAFLVPLSTFGLFAQSESYLAFEQQVPPVTATLLCLVPIEIVLFIFAYILDYRHSDPSNA